MTGESQPWLPGEGLRLIKRHAPATERNRDYIAAVLQEALPDKGLVLEIASGSGEHAVHFARLFPGLDWQPSDADPDALRSIAAWAGEAGRANMRPPLAIDVCSPDWGLEHADAIMCINMVHISPWQATEGLMRGAGRLLPDGGLLYLYGPYFRPDVETAPSNLAFDEALRGRDPRWGLRQVEDVKHLALENGLIFERLIEMPANNISLLFRKGAGDF